ncbi:MAG TPA: hypothetical protein VFW33_23395 [Gemmataceae bacterium]|nr:hypothetical protein [Gemmataceae bacterium]
MRLDPALECRAGLPADTGVTHPGLARFAAGRPRSNAVNKAEWF